jgi:hypothetical protein
LLIAALASLSTVAFPEDRDELEELLREDLAIASSPWRRSRQKTLQRRNGSRCNSNDQCPDMLKGTAARCSGALRHGQRPKVMAVRQALRADEPSSPTSLLNHETSDHLLSLR